ncbi:sensor histidine kinase [Streptomyces syringium]|uniref:sensor histidine kinase n=1 Tax=Streptomyces syringium TaxID=76729 RepID=UPI0037CF6BB0
MGASDEPASRPRPTRHTPARHTTAERAAAAPQAGPHPTRTEADRPGAAQPQQALAGAEQVGAAPQPNGNPLPPKADKPGAAAPHAGRGTGLLLAPAHATPHAAHRRPQVTVTVRADGGELLLRVGDTGPGVAAEVVDEVFRRGWSTKTAGPAPHGRGLGLALVRQAARRNGGTVTVGESPAGGAEFTVRLPLPVTASATASATTSACTPGATP